MLGRMMIRSFSLALCLALGVGPALATTQDDVLAARLLPGWQTKDGTRIAAVELVLAQGWKTYWRSPGDAGIPPSFDWSGSKNVQSVRILWPAPTVFHTNGMQTIGYHDQLVLPVEVTPQDPSLPVRLSLRLDLGVCDQICLPASVTLGADLAATGAPDAAIAAALAQRPVGGAKAGVTAVACTVDPIADGLRLTARLRLPDPGTAEVVAFETSDPAVWVAEATTRRDGADLVSVTELVAPDGAPFALDRSGVTLTILAASGAVEVKGCPAP
jgi:DsbC/DsbD-like thiol-disulfide interchange protein